MTRLRSLWRYLRWAEAAAADLAAEQHARQEAEDRAHTLTVRCGFLARQAVQLQVEATEWRRRYEAVVAADVGRVPDRVPREWENG